MRLLEEAVVERIASLVQRNKFWDSLDVGGGFGCRSDVPNGIPGRCLAGEICVAQVQHMKRFVSQTWAGILLLVGWSF